MLLKKELDLSQLQNTITQKIEATISKSQKEFYLREQLKTIKKELGIEKDDKTSDREKFEARLKKVTVPDEVKSVINEELEKIATLEPQSAEYALSRNYLDWLTIVPWGIKSPDIHNLAEAEQILEKDHYGLEDIKAAHPGVYWRSQTLGQLKREHPLPCRPSGCWQNKHWQEHCQSSKPQVFPLFCRRHTR